MSPLVAASDSKGSRAVALLRCPPSAWRSAMRQMLALGLLALMVLVSIMPSRASAGPLTTHREIASPGSVPARQELATLVVAPYELDGDWTVITSTGAGSTSLLELFTANYQN